MIVSALMGPLIMRHVGAALALLACCASPARADWSFTAYRGDAATTANTVHIEHKAAGAGTDYTLKRASYDGQGWQKPVYYGYRLTHFSHGRPWLGLEAEFTHAKAVANVNQTLGINGASGTLSQVLQHYELSHGLNLALVNLVARRRLGENSAARRVDLVARAGGGLTFPHVEAIFEGVRTNEYEYGGPAWQLGGGAEWRLVAGLTAVADARLSVAYEHVDIGPAHLSGIFVSRHFDIGLAWHLGRR
jgi:hypothetical protein